MLVLGTIMKLYEGPIEAAVEWSPALLCGCSAFVNLYLVSLSLLYYLLFISFLRQLGVFLPPVSPQVK